MSSFTQEQRTEIRDMIRELIKEEMTVSISKGFGENWESADKEITVKLGLNYEEFAKDTT